MNIQELDNKTMEALELLAKTNVQIGTAKGILAELQKTEVTFLEEREKKTIQTIVKILDKSDETIKQIGRNYEDVKSFHNTVSSYVGFLTEMQEKFSVLVDSFEKKAELWEKSVMEKEQELKIVQRNIKVQQQAIETDKKSIERGLKTLEIEKQVIESRQAQITEALAVLHKKQAK